MIGKSIPRKESNEKITGRAKFVNDHISPGHLHAQLKLSPYAHAKIKSINDSRAKQMPGVRKIITGRDFPVLTGPILVDRPPIAIDVVRYYGEVVAIVIADTVSEAMHAAEFIEIDYEPLPVLNSPSESLQKGAPLLHMRLGEYERIGEVHPKVGTNIANHVKIRKGDIQKGWAESEVIVEQRYTLPQADHAAMEPRTAIAEITPDGNVKIETASQAPYIARNLIAKFYGIDTGKIAITVPFVGGGFGGKGSVSVEYLAYMASKVVGGKEVKLANTREADMITSPIHVGLEAHVKMGCTKDGKLKAAEITYLFDGGAYSDMGAIMAKSAAADCTGPYKIDHVKCDSFLVYTNHPYSTAFRGFSHPELTFPIERTMDLLAKKLGIDPFQLRIINAIGPGDTTPTQWPLSRGIIGDLPKCIAKVKELMNWDEGQRVVVDGHKVRAKGAACIWKASSTASFAGSGAVITFNQDGSLNLSVGAVELGQGTKTVLAQIAAERMKMNVEDVHVTMVVNTKYNPYHWKTVASCTTYMAGRATIEAVDDAIKQIKQTASGVLKVLPEDLEVAGGKVFWRQNKHFSIDLKDIGLGYTYKNGITINGQIIGRGKFVQPRLTKLDPKTGKGHPGPWRTVGAKIVEVEFDTIQNTYRIVRAAAVIDAGTILNPGMATAQIEGGMSMGLSYASREGFMFDKEGRVLNDNLRSYPLIRFGETPEFLVEFVETPEIDGPYGARGLGEYGVIGMPAALANSLSIASGVELCHLPLVPEAIWRAKGGQEFDSI